ADRLLSQCGSRISWRRRRLDPRVQGVAARLTAAGFQIDDGLRQYAIEIGSGLTHGAHVCTSAVVPANSRVTRASSSIFASAAPASITLAAMWTPSSNDSAAFAA